MSTDEAIKDEPRQIILYPLTISYLLRLESYFDSREEFDVLLEEDAYRAGFEQGQAVLARELLAPILNYRHKK